MILAGKSPTLLDIKGFLLVALLSKKQFQFWKNWESIQEQPNHGDKFQEHLAPAKLNEVHHYWHKIPRSTWLFWLPSWMEGQLLSFKFCQNKKSWFNLLEENDFSLAVNDILKSLWFRLQTLCGTGIRCFQRSKLLFWTVAGLFIVSRCPLNERKLSINETFTLLVFPFSKFLILDWL